MFENAKNLEMLIRLLVKVQPYWPLPNVGNHHSEFGMIGILNIIYHPPSMTLWVTSEWTHILIGSLLVVLGGDRLIHIHQNWWAHEPIATTSTDTHLLIQICRHHVNTIGQESPTNMHMNAFVWPINIAKHGPTPKKSLI
jgi:hypothetical protein